MTTVVENSAQSQEKSSRLKDLLKTRLTNPAFVGVAIASHEIIGFSWMFGCWILMYRINPTQSLCRKFPHLNQYMARSDAWTRKFIHKYPTLQRS